MAHSTEPPLADTSDMIGLHRIFREALAGAPQYVGAVADDDRERADLVGSYYANVFDLLHSHHEGEDLLLTPRLLARRPQHAQAIGRIAGQHVMVLGALDDAAAAVAGWRAVPSGTNRREALTALAALDAELTVHLDEEERDILPVAAECITAPEWGELPAHGMRSFRGDKMWLIVGLVREQMTDEQKAAMEANMPPALLSHWNERGSVLFDAFVSDLRGRPS